jgi:hypothetical protein
MKTLSEMNVQEKREALQSVLSSGKFVKVIWTKKDGSIAERTIKSFIERLFTSGDKNDVDVNPAANISNMFTAVDVTNSKWVNINLDNLIEVKSGSVVYK